MVADTDTTTTWASGWTTTNPTVAGDLATVAGDLATMWGHFATVPIVQTVEVATHLRMLTGPRLRLTRCRLFRRVRVLVARDGTKETLHKSLKRTPDA
jgi:hypothetical protein